MGEGSIQWRRFTTFAPLDVLVEVAREQYHALFHTEVADQEEKVDVPALALGALVVDVDVQDPEVLATIAHWSSEAPSNNHHAHHSPIKKTLRRYQDRDRQHLAIERVLVQEDGTNGAHGEYETSGVGQDDWETQLLLGGICCANVHVFGPSPSQGPH